MVTSIGSSQTAGWSGSEAGGDRPTRGGRLGSRGSRFRPFDGYGPSLATTTATGRCRLGGRRRGSGSSAQPDGRWHRRAEPLHRSRSCDQTTMARRAGGCGDAARATWRSVQAARRHRVPYVWRGDLRDCRADRWGARARARATRSRRFGTLRCADRFTQRFHRGRVPGRSNPSEAVATASGPGGRVRRRRISLGRASIGPARMRTGLPCSPRYGGSTPRVRRLVRSRSTTRVHAPPAIAASRRTRTACGAAPSRRARVGPAAHPAVPYSREEAQEAPTWPALASRLGRWGRWEFEDYRPSRRSRRPTCTRRAARLAREFGVRLGRCGSGTLATGTGSRPRTQRGRPGDRMRQEQP